MCIFLTLALALADGGVAALCPSTSQQDPWRGKRGFDLHQSGSVGAYLSLFHLELSLSFDLWSMLPLT